MPRFRISYVDGTSAEGDAEDWPIVRADGVDAVTFDDVTFQGHSVYWVRRIDDGWACGAASFYPNPLVEVRVLDGRQEEVRLDPHAVPDLMHIEVKLGAWWRE